MQLQYCPDIVSVQMAHYHVTLPHQSMGSCARTYQRRGILSDRRPVLDTDIHRLVDNAVENE
jgi:hypothetical protein